MTLRSVRIGRLAGIPIGVQPLWLLIVALITWSLGAVYYPEEVAGIAPAAAYALGLLSALLLFASILLHELGHAIVARRHGVEIEEIDLWLLGGVARMAGYPKEARDELRFALAGPAVTAVIATLFGVAYAALPADAPDALAAVLAYQLLINTVILVFNLLPAFPLDGGRVARALIWRWTGDLERATKSAAGLGRALGYAMIGIGVFGLAAGGAGGLWLAVVGVFVVVAARAEQEGLRVKTALEGRAAGNLMAYPAVCVPAECSVEDAVRDYFVPRRYHAFPVIEDGRLIGLVDRTAVARVAVDRRPQTTVGAIALRAPGLVVDESQDVAELIGRPAFREAGRAAVRTGDGGIGIVSITDVEEVLRALELASPA